MKIEELDSFTRL